MPLRPSSVNSVNVYSAGNTIGNISGQLQCNRRHLATVARHWIRDITGEDGSAGGHRPSAAAAATDWCRKQRHRVTAHVAPRGVLGHVSDAGQSRRRRVQRPYGNVQCV